MSYFVVHDWMITKLKLKGLERDVFAIIYGFSPKKNTGVFNGSLDYLAEATGCTKVRVCYALAELVEKKLIVKKDIYKGDSKKYKTCEYKTNSEIVNKLLTEHIQNVNDNVNKKLTIHIQNVNDNVNKLLTNSKEYNRDSISDSIEIGEGEKTLSHSPFSNTQNNLEIKTPTQTSSEITTELTKKSELEEYQSFESAIISYAQTCGRLVSTLSQCLQGQPHARLEKEKQIRSAFEYRKYDWTHSIESAKNHAQRNTTDVRFRFNNFLERLIQNLNHGDGSNIPQYKNDKAIEIEKQNRESLGIYTSSPNVFIERLKRQAVEVK